MSVQPVLLPDPGLGNTAYLVDLGDGRALVVDASLDLRTIRSATESTGLRVAFAADTHLHADFLSAAPQLGAAEGTTVIASASGGREFPHVGLRDDEEIDLGGLQLRAIATPGHTDEHLAFLLLDGNRPVGVFTGGSLLVGAVARTDLVDPDRSEELARAQYRSLRRLLELPDDVAVWPTHGAGSFCSAPAGAQRTSTIGRERQANPLLAAPDEDAFVAALTESLGSFPAYFRRLSEANRRGTTLPDDALALPALTAEQVHARLRDGLLVDVRPAHRFAAGHVPGSLSIPLRDAFATWLGWIAPADVPLVVLRDLGQDPEEICWQATKIGYHNLVGELAGGLEAWEAAGYPIQTTRQVSPAAVDRQQVVDVRQHSEYVAGHLPGSVNVELGALPGDDVPQGELLVMCSHGERAMTAASLLERSGREVAALVGGPDDWAESRGKLLETGG